MTNISSKLKIVTTNETAIKQLMREIKVARNDILVATSSWEKVDVIAWNTMKSQWFIIHSLRFSSKTGKPNWIEFNSADEYLESTFYAVYVKHAIEGIDYVDVKLDNQS